ncbi:MAG: beta-N-acetylhexosaminidase [Bacteroidota bacterium]
MRKLVPVILLMHLVLAVSAQNKSLTSLMPAPKTITVNSGRFALTPAFTVAVIADATDTTLYFAVNRALQTLNRRTQLYFGQQRITANDRADSSSLVITVKNKAGIAIGQDESYSLISTNGKIKLDAPNTTGILRGLETFLQLVQHDTNGYYLPLVSIHDSPRFIWRGLMIDVARHFIPIDVIERNIDAMAAVKMNILHLHLSDDEGFRIESKVYPQLQMKGSYGEYYTQAQIKELIVYAKNRGIIIMPEFDMPGHTTGFLAGYPYLSAKADTAYTPGPRFSLGAKSRGLVDIMKMINTFPTPAFNPAKESTYLFLDKFLGEMAALFPSPYIHIGADENNGVSWKNNPSIVAFMKQKNLATTHDLQAYFVNRVQQILAKHHKKTIGWEELLSKELPKDVAVQVWQNPAMAKQAAGLGHPVIISQGLYLDLFMPAYIHYQNSLLDGKLSDTLQAKVFGGEAAQWAEAADKTNIEARMWPRTAAIAERLWSPNEVNDVDDMYRRLAIISTQLDEIGLQHISSYQRGLRRLSGSNDVATLQTLTDVLTPIKGYKKMFAKIMLPKSSSYQTAPLNAVSDIILVDSETKRAFRSAVKQYLQTPDTDTENYISAMLDIWKNNNAKIVQLKSTGHLDNTVYQHSKNLADAADIGLQALKKLKNKETPPADWINEKLTYLKELNKVFGETEIAVLPEIEALVAQKLQPEPKEFPMF